MSKRDPYPVLRPFSKTASPAVPQQAPTEHSLTVDAGSSLSEIFVIDGDFNLVKRAQGKLTERLPEGEYLVKYRAGDRYAEDWITLDEDRTVRPAEPLLAHTVSRMGNEWTATESTLARRLSGSHTLSIIVRDADRKPPYDDVRIQRTDGTIIARLIDSPGKNWARRVEGKVLGWGGNVPAGGYILAVVTPGFGSYAMPIWVAPGCSTQVFLERRSLGLRGNRRKGPHLASASVCIAGSQAPMEEVFRLFGLAETAKSALSEDRLLIPDMNEINKALEPKFLCPILGLLAAHLLRLKYEERKMAGDAHAKKLGTQLQTVVRNLAKLMPGSSDVGALQLAVESTSDADFSIPPMLAHSWAILVGLRVSPFPAGSFAERMRTAICATRPWLVCNMAKIAKATDSPEKTRTRSVRATVPPEMLEAVQQFSKRLKLNVNSDGRVTLVRR